MVEPVLALERGGPGGPPFYASGDPPPMFTSHIAKLEEKLAAAEAKGDQRGIKDASDSIATYTSWLEQARATLDEFKR